MSSITLHPFPNFHLTSRSIPSFLAFFTVWFFIFYPVSSNVNNRPFQLERIAIAYASNGLVVLLLTLLAILAIKSLQRHQTITIHPNRTISIGQQHPVPFTSILLQETLFGVTIELKTPSKSLRVGRFRSLHEAQSFADKVRLLIV